MQVKLKTKNKKQQALEESVTWSVFYWSDKINGDVNTDSYLDEMKALSGDPCDSQWQAPVRWWVTQCSNS